MAELRRCDRCGVTGELYHVCSPFYLQHATITFSLRVEGERGTGLPATFHLCSDCTASLGEWLRSKV